NWLRATEAAWMFFRFVRRVPAERSWESISPILATRGSHAHAGPAFVVPLVPFTDSPPCCIADYLGVLIMAEPAALEARVTHLERSLARFQTVFKICVNAKEKVVGSIRRPDGVSRHAKALGRRPR